MIPSNTYHQITDFLQKIDSIQFAYIFGSAITDYYIPGKSDIDIGIFCDNEIDVLQQIEWQDDLSEILEGNPTIDIINMKDDAPALMNEIINHGQPLFINNQDIHDLYIVSQMSKYIEYNEWIQQYDVDLLKRTIN